MAPYTYFTSITASGQGIDAGGNGDVGPNATVFLTVTADAPVYVPVQTYPIFTLNDGGSAFYLAGSGTNTLYLYHTVAQNQNTADLALTGYYYDVIDRNSNPVLAGELNDNPPGILQVDTTSPLATAFAAQSSTGHSPVGLGQSMTFTIDMSEPVTVSGAPVLALSNGAVATYTPALSSASSLVFSYTVATGQDTADLTLPDTASPQGALILNGGSIADLAGNLFTQPILADTGYAIDTQAPFVAFEAGPIFRTSTQQTLLGSVDLADAGTTVSVYEGNDTTPLASATVDAGGNWSVDLTLAPGSHSLVARDTDLAGNVGQDTSTVIVSAPPSIVFDPTVSLQGASFVTFTLSASADPSLVSIGLGVSNVEVFNGSKDLGAATDNGDGTFSLTEKFTSRSANGKDLLNLNAVVTDSFGGTSTASSPYGLTVDGNFPATVPQSFVGATPSYSSIQYVFDDQGNIAGESFFKKNGQLLYGAISANQPDGSHLTAYANGSFFDAEPYNAFSQTLSSGGDLLQEAIGNKDGTSSITAYADGQTLNGTLNDTFTSLGSNENYVFTSGFGQETITDFHTSGPGYDSLSLSKADLPGRHVKQLAHIIGKIQDGPDGLTVPLAHGDSITMLGVTKADLLAEYQQHPKAFKLTA